jgi:hypothetical protein
MKMESRRIVILKLLASIFGGAVLTPALLCALPLIIPSSDRVPGSTIPALASIGAVYGGFCGILWAYRPTMDNNRVAQVLYTVGFMLGGVFGYIAGVVSTEGIDTLSTGLMGFFIGSAAVLIAPALNRK